MRHPGQEQRASLLARLRSNLPLYAEKCLRIKNKKGREVPLIFDRKQHYIWRIIASKFKAEEPVEIIDLKARQVYMSTFWQAVMSWITTLNTGISALICGYDFESAQNILRMQQLMYQYNPLKPMLKTMNRQQIYYGNPNPEQAAEFPGINSEIIAETADNPNIGRSFRFHMYQLSEFAFYDKVCNPDALLASLNQSIPEGAGTIKVIESTANGETRLKDLWFGTKQYPNWIRIFTSWVSHWEYRLDNFKPFTLCDSETADFGDETTEIKHVRAEVAFWWPELHGTDLEQEIWKRLHWRRWKIENDCLGNLNIFRQEYPTTPTDAFIASGETVFNQNVLSEISALLIANQPESERFRFDIHAYRRSGADWFMRSLIPSKFGDLRIYERPQTNMRYVIGVDPSFGLHDRDPAAIVVFCLETMAEVASFNGVLSPEALGQLTYVLGKMYNNALIGIETNSIGQETQKTLFGLKYYNLYRRAKVGNKALREFTADMGWYTDGKSKRRMVQEMQEAVTHYEIDWHSLELVRQLLSFQRLNDKEEMGAPEGKHDDMAMAAMIAYQMARNSHISTYQPIVVQPGSFDWFVNSHQSLKNANWDSDPLRTF